MRGSWLWLLLVVSPIGLAQNLDQGTAYAEALQEIIQQCNAASPANGTHVDMGSLKVKDNGSTIGIDANCIFGNGNPQGAYFSYRGYVSKCAARPASTSGWSSAGNGASCSGGCAYGPSSSSDTLTVAGRTYFSLAGAKPTGAICAPGDGTGEQVSSEQCAQAGSLTQCVKPDGRHCATASTGKQFCWAPGEAGVKKADNNNQAATKSPANTSINAPKDPPANGGDWTVTGQGSVSETKGGTTTTSTITTFDSSYGKTGTGKGDGTGASGGSGGGTGDGDGDGDGQGDGPGAPGQSVGELYKGTELTVDGLVREYYGKVSSTPMLNSVRSFMMVQGGGSCPVFALAATRWTPSLTFDAHCSGTVYNALLAMGWVLFAIVAYFAIRISVT